MGRRNHPDTSARFSVESPEQILNLIRDFIKLLIKVSPALSATLAITLIKAEQLYFQAKVPLLSDMFKNFIDGMFIRNLERPELTGWIMLIGVLVQLIKIAADHIDNSSDKTDRDVLEQILTSIDQILRPLFPILIAASFYSISSLANPNSLVPPNAAFVTIAASLLPILLYCRSILRKVSPIQRKKSNVLQGPRLQVIRPTTTRQSGPVQKEFSLTERQDENESKIDTAVPYAIAVAAERFSELSLQGRSILNNHPGLIDQIVDEPIDIPTLLLLPVDDATNYMSELPDGVNQRLRREYLSEQDLSIFKRLRLAANLVRTWNATGRYIKVARKIHQVAGQDPTEGIDSDFDDED